MGVQFVMQGAALRSRVREYWRQEIRPLLVLALVLCAVRSSFADWNDVPTGSMKPTILEGDRVFVNRLAYDLKVPFTTRHIAEWGNPRRGDIAVFYSPYDGTRLVKRVVGLPGDVVELRKGRLVINDTQVDYEPLGAGIADQLPETERRQSLFAAERLPSHSHAVMAIPGVPARRDFGPVRVPGDQYFMMGDNRDNSFDSRFFGMVERRRILGKVTHVVLSVDKSNWWLPRAQRFFRRIDDAEG